MSLLQPFSWCATPLIQFCELQQILNYLFFLDACIFYLLNLPSSLSLSLSLSHRLVIQRTKRVDESQTMLLQLLEALTSGTEEERQELMAVCIEILSNYPMSDLVTPIFVFEQLSSIIHPVS